MLFSCGLAHRGAGLTVNVSGKTLKNTLMLRALAQPVLCKVCPCRGTKNGVFVLKRKQTFAHLPR